MRSRQQPAQGARQGMPVDLRVVARAVSAGGQMCVDGRLHALHERGGGIRPGGIAHAEFAVAAMPVIAKEGGERVCQRGGGAQPRERRGRLGCAKTRRGIGVCGDGGDQRVELLEHHRTLDIFGAAE